MYFSFITYSSFKNFFYINVQFLHMFRDILISHKATGIINVKFDNSQMKQLMNN